MCHVYSCLSLLANEHWVDNISTSQRPTNGDGLRGARVCVFKIRRTQSIIHFKVCLQGHSISTLSVSLQTSWQYRRIVIQLLCLILPANEDLWLMVSNQIDDLHSGAATMDANHGTDGEKRWKGGKRSLRGFEVFPSGVMHRLHGRTLCIVLLFYNWGRWS